MSKFESISLQELEMFRSKLATEVETLRQKLMIDLDTLEKKSLELNDILIEIEDRNAESKSPIS